MTSKPDGGPAFPLALAANSGPYKPGMSLRQYIIIELVAAQISHKGIQSEGYEKNYVATANRYADVMLAEGEK